MMPYWLTSPEWTNVVKALLHTLWQGMIIAVLLGLALRQLTNPTIRYRCSLVALVGVVVAGLITWGILCRPLPPVSNKASTPPAASTAANVATVSSELPPVVVNLNLPPPQTKSLETPWTAWLAVLWIMGAAAMLCRAAYQVAGAERLRRSSRPLDDPGIVALLAETRKAVGLARRVRLAVTDKLTSPVVAGVLVPTLILPLSLTTTLSPQQIRFILLHELAHIRRGDYFANLFQLFAEALLFFNPAVWWISRQMRIEREACCDALAVELSGAPADYARTLVRVVENVLSPAPVAAPALGDKREPSSLTDRVQRMLVPGYRPSLRLTWRAMFAALFTGGILLFLSAIGTRETIAAILSPQERIDRIEKKMTEYGQNPATLASYNENDAYAKVTVAGHVRMADGSPVPKQISMQIYSEAPHSSVGAAIDARNGKFSYLISPGRIYVGTEITNYAPAVVGPLDGTDTNKIGNLEVVIEPGFDVPLQVVDADSGQGLTDGTIATMFWMSTRGFQSRSFKSFKTGEDGSLILEHCADVPLDIIVNAPGYVITQKHFDHLRAGETLRMELRRGETISGKVLDLTTRRPLAGAELRVLYQAGADNPGRFNWDDSLHLLGKSDTDGTFSLNQLQRGIRYYIGVSAPGHESVILSRISAVNMGLVVLLGPELIVRGHATGNFDNLPEIDGCRALTLDTSEVYEDHSWGANQWVPLHITNGVATFEFTNRTAGHVTLVNSQGYREEREVTAPIADWTVDLRSNQAADAKTWPKREVIFRFKDASGAMPGGTVEVTVPVSMEANHRTAKVQAMEITNGEVHVQIPIGGDTEIEPGHMVGYWFNSWEVGNNSQIIPVTNGPGPMVIKIPLIPAGAIYAKTRNADGTLAGGVLFGVSELKRAPGRDETSPLTENSDSSGNGPRKWVSGPLPLGGTYQIHSWRDNAFCISQPIKLTEENPDAEVELQFAPGKNLQGAVQDADGRPLRDAEIKPAFTLSHGGGFGLKSVFTDEQGRFELENTTPDLGVYSVEVNAPGMMAERAKLKFGSQPQIIRLQRGHTLGGRLVQAGTGYVIPDVEVSAFDSEHYTLPAVATRTDADGRFEFNTLGNGSYTLISPEGQIVPDQKYRADGNTNLVLKVKLYDWSNVKPKATTTQTDPPTDPATDSEKTTVKNGLARSAGPARTGESSNQRAITFVLSNPRPEAEVKKLLLDAGVKIPPTIFFYNENGVFLVRGSPEQLALVDRVVVQQNGFPTNHAEENFIKNLQRNSSDNQTTNASALFQRTFKLDPGTFSNFFQKQDSSESNNPTELIRDFASRLGVDLESPQGKSFFYNERLGYLFVKATASDLDVIERGFQVISQVRPQLHIKARFISVPKNTLEGFENFLHPINSGNGQFIGILTSSNTQAILHALQSRKGVETLGESEITVNSGRETQMRATSVATIFTGMNFKDAHTNQDGTIIASASAISSQTNTVEFGPIFDLLPSVLSDGYTIHLPAKALLTEFFGYAQVPKDMVIRYFIPDRTLESNGYASGGQMLLANTWPAVQTRSQSANANLYDGQTLVLSLNQTQAEQIHFSADERREAAVAQQIQDALKKNGEGQVLVLVTATLVNPAGARIHSDAEMPFAQSGIPPQPPDPTNDDSVNYSVKETLGKAEITVYRKTQMGETSVVRNVYFSKPDPTNALIRTGPGRQAIVAKLDRIHLDNVSWDNLPLKEVLKQLAEQTKLRDPERKGVNFLIYNGTLDPFTGLPTPAPDANSLSPTIDPITGQPVPLAVTETQDVGSYLIKMPNLKDVRLGDALDAIALASDHPLKYSVQDFAVVFSAKGPETPQLFMRTFRIDPNTFYRGLEITSDQNPGAAPDMISRFPGIGNISSSSNTPSALARAFFTTLGVNLTNPPGKSVFFNERLGYLFVKATKPDLDTIQRALQVLNQTTPQVHIKARFYEVPKGSLDDFGKYLNATNPTNGTPMGILSSKTAKAAIKEVQLKKDFEVLAEPEVTMISGRQVQMRATEMDTNARSGPLLSQANNNAEIGPILDVVPYVLADDQTINLAIIPADKGLLPKFTVRQLVSTMNVWDNQTVVLLPQWPLTDTAATPLGETSDKQLVIFITATIVGPAGNRVHSDDELLSAQKGIPPQPDLTNNNILNFSVPVTSPSANTNGLDAQKVRFQQRLERIIKPAATNDAPATSTNTAMLFMHQKHVQPAPQLHIKARFISVPDKTLEGSENFLRPINPANDQFAGITTSSNMQAVLRALRSQKGVETLGEPEMTAMNGQQVQMRATQMTTVVIGLNFSTNAIAPQTY